MKELFIYFFLILSSTQLYTQTLPNLQWQEVEIILLGEQTHGDGAVFDAKVNLIKKLHEEQGFTIVAFESGLYDNFKAHQLVTEGKEEIEIYNQSVFSIWAETQAFQNLLNYKESQNDLMMLGFDCQEGTLFKEYYDTFSSIYKYISLKTYLYC